MKTFQVLLRDRRKVLVKANSYEERDERIVFLPFDQTAAQWFLKEKVDGIHVWAEDDESGE